MLIVHGSFEKYGFSDRSSENISLMHDSWKLNFFITVKLGFEKPAYRIYPAVKKKCSVAIVKTTVTK